ncbi:hypothetical protein [Actinacidiphila sp. ITFR-21]|uniref:hypothetical protein n=1 Tax=Actinacidiphila sp. ITFR-21 TaxID=3075199 RepID=UPI00288A2C80|nr:hypothetical protein [Streptomyces sp. ITFR-21]WNI17163.1 hypothetical protein RLT57_17675 [Streptomyces sp. ITFR-21]
MVALIAAGSAACGTAQANHQGTVRDAFTALGEQKSLTLDVSFDAPADRIYAVLRGEDGFTRDDARSLADLRARYAVSADRPLGRLQAGDKDVSVAVAVSDDAAGRKNLVEVRRIAGTLYVRADVKGLAKADSTLSGGDGGKSGGTGGGPKDGGGLSGLNRLLDGSGHLPASLGAVEDAFDGRWISVDQKLLDTLGMFTGSGAAPEPDARSQTRLLAALENALAGDAVFKDLGSRGGTDHVQVTVPARQLAKALKSPLASALKDVPGFSGGQLKELDAVPDKAVTADVAVKNGAVSAVTVDVAQFDGAAHPGTLPLVVTFDSGAAAVTAPADAKALDPADLAGLFTSGLLPGSGGTDDSNDSNDSATGSGSAPGPDTGSGGGTPATAAEDDSSTGYFSYSPLP